MLDKQYQGIAEQVYWVERERTDVEYHPEIDEKYEYDLKNEQLGQFHVIDVEDNPDNGMQAMAVAPVIDGQVDYSQIVIAYAGTNFGDGKDRQTDINSIMLGHNYFEVEPEVPADSQIDTALAFAEKIKRLCPDAKIETTGHSLGGFLATIVSIKNKWEMTAFNAPSAHKFLTESDKQWITHGSCSIGRFRWLVYRWKIRL